MQTGGALHPGTPVWSEGGRRAQGFGAPLGSTVGPCPARTSLVVFIVASAVGVPPAAAARADFAAGAHLGSPVGVMDSATVRRGPARRRGRRRRARWCGCSSPTSWWSAVRVHLHPVARGYVGPRLHLPLPARFLFAVGIDRRSPVRRGGRNGRLPVDETGDGRASFQRGDGRVGGGDLLRRGGANAGSRCRWGRRGDGRGGEPQRAGEGAGRRRRTQKRRSDVPRRSLFSSAPLRPDRCRIKDGR